MWCRSKIKSVSAILAFSLFIGGCGLDGDPGHCYFSLDWEYYNPSYGVYYYEDNNPDVPESEDIVPRKYYDSYPGLYDYYYESEDSFYVYTYTGEYELIQNQGMPGGVFQDGQDGADSYLDLFLFIYEEVGLQKKSKFLQNDEKDVCGNQESRLNAKNTKSGKIVAESPVMDENREKTYQQGNWTIQIDERVRVYLKIFN